MIFSWEYYAANPLQIFNVRGGGMAIYGAVIAAVCTALIYCKVKKYDTWLLIDTAIPGLALGQAIGRWGNFCNQEVFGGYTDGLFAMRLNVETAAYTTPELMEKAITEGGVTYIQVQPTFLYESFGKKRQICCVFDLKVSFYAVKITAEAENIFSADVHQMQSMPGHIGYP